MRRPSTPSPLSGPEGLIFLKAALLPEFAERRLSRAQGQRKMSRNDGDHPQDPGSVNDAKAAAVRLMLYGARSSWLRWPCSRQGILLRRASMQVCLAQHANQDLVTNDIALTQAHQHLAGRVMRGRMLRIRRLGRLSSWQNGPPPPPGQPRQDRSRQRARP
jgi:hypothetical protein